MKRPLFILAGLPLLLWAVLALPDVAASARNLWDWRRALILLSGTLALWWMSAGMVLAARRAGLERLTGGLDRLYRLHKHIGIGVGAIVFAHWMLEWLPKKLAKAGILTRPARGPRPPGGEDAWIELAKDVGEWAGYILLALVVVALLRRIPYRYFRWVHKLFPLVFAGGAFHGLMLIPAAWWQGPLAWTTALVALPAAAVAAMSLGGRIGARRRVEARIVAIREYRDNVTEVLCEPVGHWPGHLAGQHALVDFGDKGEGAHPFTLAGAWNPDERVLHFAIKALGDYTRRLPGRLAVGQAMSVEGPYGGFTFEASPGPQVWVAGGIGITPFIGRLQALAAQGGSREPVDLFYSTGVRVPGGYADDIAPLCAAAGVTLHRHISSRDGLLDDAAIGARIRPGTSVWFCGPAAWGARLAERFRADGRIAPGDFHRELFDFR